MSTITSAASALARRLIVPAAAGAVILGAVFGVVATLDAPVAAARSHHGGAIYGPSPNNRYWSITGRRLGAPTEGEVSTYGGSHKHLWVEQQLYGPGVVRAPNVDITVHQSR